MTEREAKHSIIIQWRNTEYQLGGVEQTSPDHLPPSYQNLPKVKEMLDAMTSMPDQIISCAVIEHDGIPVSIPSFTLESHHLLKLA